MNRPNWPAGVGIGDRFASRDQVLERGRKGATGLAQLGVQPGDRIAFLMHNDISFFEAWAAARSLGAVPVPLNYHSNPGELDEILDDSRAAAVVGHADILGDVLSPAARRGRVVISVDVPPEVAATNGRGKRTPPTTDGLRWAELVAANSEWPDGPFQDTGTLMYTGGSTGRPKGIRRMAKTPEQTAIYMQTVRQVYGIVPGLRTVVCAPIYHSAPLFYSTAGLMDGATIVLQSRFNPAELLALVERHSITNLMLVPTMIVRLLRLPEDTRMAYDLSSLTHIIHGAAPCPPEVKRAIIEWLGPIVHEYYGCTESGVVTAVNSQEWLDRPGTVGKRVLGAELRIIRDDGEDAGIGEVGQLYVRSDGQAAFTYENMPEERAAIERDGMVTCGDLGKIDADGFLYLAGRAKDMVIVGGVNIFPAEIENELVALPEVLDCAAFGIPDPEYGEVVAAAVTLVPGSSVDETYLRQALAAKFGGFKVPRHIAILARLPRDESGKIMKRQLRELDLFR